MSRSGVSMLRAAVLAVAFLAIGVLGSPPARADAADPSLHEVYTAVQAGQYARAQRMMAVVLEHHPKSAKAHYVAAEVDARAGDLAAARRELGVAESLEPGLPFATPGSVRELRARLGGGAAVGPGTARSGLPWGWIALALVVVAGLAFAFRRRRAAAPGDPGWMAPTGPSAPVAPAGPAPWGAVPPASPGVGVPPAAGAGSGLLGTLATGATLGAGVVAGEALAHRLLDGGHGTGESALDEEELRRRTAVPADPPLPPDFGVDGGGWDDPGNGDAGGGSDDAGGASGGGDDWT
jgi:hypothetical protein